MGEPLNHPNFYGIFPYTPAMLGYPIHGNLHISPYLPLDRRSLVAPCRNRSLWDPMNGSCCGKNARCGRFGHGTWRFPSGEFMIGVKWWNGNSMNGKSIHHENKIHWFSIDNHFRTGYQWKIINRCKWWFSHLKWWIYTYGVSSSNG